MFSKALTIAAALVSMNAVAISAQQVTYWENSVNSERDLQFDTEQCNEYARGYSARMTPAPVNAPRGALGQIVGGLANIGRQEMAQSYFDGAFESCMQRLGWREVTTQELTARQTEIIRAEQAEADRAAREHAARERAIAEYRTTPPQIDSTYDEFERRTLVMASPAYLENSSGTLNFSGGFLIAVPRAANGEQMAMLIFETASPGNATVGTDASLILLVDGGEPIRFQGQQVSYETANDEDGCVLERIRVTVPPETLRSFARATLIRARLGGVEFAYPPHHMAALRTLADRLRAPRPAAVRRR